MSAPAKKKPPPGKGLPPGRTQRTRKRSQATLVVAVAAVLVLIGVVAVRSLSGGGTEVTAMFTRAVGLYPGDEVRILGVPVGRVDEIIPEADGVRVRMTLQEGVSAPAGADAVLVQPSLVASRYVQLTPAWSSGPKLADGATIAMERTSVPVEWDELKSALDTFARDLGPDRPDGSGPLGRAVSVASENLKGRGTSINGTIEGLNDAVEVLARNRGDIYGTVTNLAKFTQTLKASDQEVRLFADQMNTLTTLLAANRADLAQALKDVRAVMPDLQDFLKDAGPVLQKDLEQLQVTTQILANRRQNIADTLQTSPVSLSNTLHMYDARMGATTAGITFPYVKGPGQVVCFLVSRVIPDSDQVCSSLLEMYPFLDTEGGAGAAAAQTTGSSNLTTLLTPAGALRGEAG